MVRDNPREISELLNSEGNTLDNKIERYSEIRGEEIATLHYNFYSNSPYKSSLEESIFFMDLDFFYRSIPEPKINNQFMKISKKVENGKILYKISSSFPLASLILKKSCKYQPQTNFLELRLQQLKQSMLLEKDGGVLGTFYEELIQTIFENIALKIKRGRFYTSLPQMNISAKVKFFYYLKLIINVEMEVRINYF